MRLREDFELNPDWKRDSSVEDTVGHFFDQGGGPSWMFATSCAMLLRSAGYRTRLVSGFLVQEKDYDYLAGQSIVTSENLHMWPEVCLDGKFWIPLEPTPGCPIPYSTQTTWQWLTAKASLIAMWFWNRPVVSLLLVGVTFLSYRFRAQIVTSLMLGWWHLVRLVWPNNLLATTQQLIDLRFWYAGDQRPPSKTICNWYTRVEPVLTNGFFDLWNAKKYANSPPAVSYSELVACCREPIERLSFHKINQFVSVIEETKKQ